MQERIAQGLLIAALLVCGCGNPATTDSTGSLAKTESPPVEETVAAVETPPPDQGREPPFESQPPETAAPAGVTLTDAPWEGVVEQIAAHKGKIVVVDLWATYCVPCRTSFPGLVALSKQDPENIVCISVSLDDPEDQKKRADALKFLQEQNAEFTNLLCTTESDKLYDEILQIGGIPAVYVYGRDGAQAKLFTGPTPEGEDHTYEQHITPYVTELAAAK
jgi:thiol-disulfide isomerase/thioredoxin